MPILTILFVLIVVIAAIWACQNYLPPPWKMIFSAVIALFFLWWLFGLMGLWTVRV